MSGEDPGREAQEAEAPEGGAGEEGSASFIEAEREHRLEKIERLRERGIDPYPVRYDVDRSIAEIREQFADLEPATQTEEKVKIAGRVMLIRRHGGLDFADVRDSSGEIQLFASLDELGEERHDIFRHLDLGDWVGAEGVVMTTKRGELSVKVEDFQLLAKSLRAMPKEGHGPTDVDTRFRERYLDLMVNAESRRIFDVRSATISSVRRTLVDKGFQEVETPVLATSAGGAAAKPFITHHNALDIDMYLRIALELPLKRLIVGGMGRVFEIGRVFRNEGLDTRHNPEFTLLEAYQALGDYHDMMDLVEEIVSGAAQTVGKTRVKVGEDEVNLAPPFRRVTMAELIKENAGVDMHPSMPLEEARKIADDMHINYMDEWGSGKIMSEVYDESSEDKLIDPTFVLDHPRETSPLARVHRDDPDLTERFELVVAGRELANAYSELNDPVDQRGRFEAEARLKAAGDEEAESVDEDYIRALEYGLPPTGGLGIGIDRLVMLLAEVPSIREVILFPTMRPLGDTPRLQGAVSALPTASDLAAGPEAGEARPEPAEPAESGPAEMAAEPLPDAGRHIPRILAWLVAIIGLLSFVPTLPVVRESLGIDPLLGVSGRAATHVVAIVVGIALLFIARQVARRKRSAWLLACLLLAFGFVAHLLKGPDPLIAIVDVAVLLTLVWYRKEFAAPNDPRSLLTLVFFVPAYLFVVFVFGTVSLLIERAHVDPSLSLGGILETVFGGLFGLDGPYTFENRVFADFFPVALLALGVLGLVVVLVLVFRPIVDGRKANPEERRRVEDLVRRYGSDTLAYFALADSKSYFFSSDGRSVVPYAYMGGYALASADPIGPPDALDRTVGEFLAFCRGRGWNAAFLSAREDNLPAYERNGLRGVYLGDEAIIRCDRFTLEGPDMKQVRSAANRVAKQCSFKLIRETDAPPGLVRQLNEISARWRGDEAERGFTMELARDVEGTEPDFLIGLALDAGERPLAFLRLVPCYGDDPGYSLDLMRRDPSAPNGITEFLIANCSLSLGAQGFRRLSMNFAAWGRLFEEQRKLSPLERFERWLAHVLNPYFQIESLRDFNEKFQPEWLPRSIIVEDPSAIPRVGLLFAMIEGFVDVPVVGKMLVPRVAQ